MQAKLTKQYIDALTERTGIPYLDARLIREHRVIAQASSDESITGEEPLFLYSCSKPVTVTALMTLVEGGALTLDTPVRDLLPAYGELYLADGSRAKGTLTVRHLMSMSGGLSYQWNSYPFREELEARGERSVTRAVCDGFAKGRLLFEPGTHFQYSLCHDVLGAVIEAAAAMPFSRYLEEAVLRPIGMTHTRFAKAFDEVAPFYETDAATRTVRERQRRNDFVLAEGYESGGAGLVSTVNDYARFAATLAAGGVTADGKRILTEDTLLALRTPQLTENEGFTCIQSSQGPDYAYGLGVRVRIAPTAWGLPVGEYGWDGAAGSYLMVDPVRGVSAVMGMHLLGWPNIFSGEHLRITECLFRDAGLIG